MFGKLFHICSRDESGHKRSSSSQILAQTLELFKQKESALQKKIDVEAERAQRFTRSKQKQAAMQCLKRKKFYEAQMQQLGKYQSRIHDKEEKLHNEGLQYRKDLQTNQED